MSGYQIGPALAPGEQPFRDGWEQDPEVQACNHDVWESVLIRPRHDRLEECVRCVACQAPRCGHAADLDPCVLVRHHRIHHVQLSGRLDPLGGIKCANGVGCGCGARYVS